MKLIQDLWRKALSFGSKPDQTETLQSLPKVDAPQLEEAPPPPPPLKPMTTAEIDASNEAFFARQPFNSNSSSIADMADDPFEWTISENGNLTCNWNFLNATIFQQDMRWKYVVGVDGGGTDSRSFSKGFGSEERAVAEAEGFMSELFAKMLQRRS